MQWYGNSHSYSSLFPVLRMVSHFATAQLFCAIFLGHFFKVQNPLLRPAFPAVINWAKLPLYLETPSLN